MDAPKIPVSPGTPASADPVRAKELEVLFRPVNQTALPQLDDDCKPCQEWVGSGYKRDRSGSKKKVSKTHNRAKAKAAKKARKAQR